MISNRRSQTTWGVIFLSGVLLCLSVSAMGQNRLEPGVLANPNFWSPEERQRIETYVDRQIAAILNGDDESAVSGGRDGLIDPVNTSGVTERFVEQFAELVVSKLGPLMDAEALIVRLNAMVVCMNLTHPDALKVIEKGLADDSAGVRYPAAKALEAQLASGKLGGNQTNQVLTMLEKMIGRENDVHVVQPLLDAMLAAPNNSSKVMAVLAERLDRHADRPEASYEPERNALQAVYTRLFTAPTRPEAQVKELALLSGRYMVLASQQLAAASVPAERDDSHQDIILVAASTLEFAHDNLQSREVPPPSPADAIRSENWNALVGIAQDWVTILKADPFNFTDADLKVAAAAEPAAAE